MKKIVVSQPMFFPWIGLFEQIRLADIYVHYDGVQLPQGRSFMNRVQIKTTKGVQWLTAPVIRKEKQLIKDTLLDDSQAWRKTHLKSLKMNYARAPFADEMIALAEIVYAYETSYLAEFNIFAIETIVGYFDIKRQFLHSSDYFAEKSGTEKLIELVKKLNGSVYITGHGAKNYLEHECFEKAGMRVEYMDYQRIPYPQLNGTFTPYVSILDLIANTGREGIKFIVSPSIGWRQFLQKQL